MLASPQLFRTEAFHRRLEQAARANLQREIDRLAPPKSKS